MSAPVPPRRSKGVLLFCALLCALPSRAQDAADPPADTLAARRDEARKSREEDTRQIPVIDKPVRIRDIFTVERDKDGRLSLTTTLGSEMSRGPTWIKVEGDPGIITATIFGYTGPTAPFGLQFIHTEHAHPERIQTATFVNYTANNNAGHLSIQRTVERMSGNDVVSFNASTNGVSVTIVRNDENNRRQVSTASANSFEELRDQNPALFHTHVRPILLDLGMHGFGGVSPDDAFAAFADEWPIDDKTLDAVRALIPQLSAEQFSAREKAIATLRDLGRAGAVAARKIDRTTLTDQQATLLDAVVSAHPSVPAAAAAARRRDPNFLLDCLYLEDPTIRTLALTHLRQTLAQPDLAFDANAPIDKRRADIEALRRNLK